MKPDFKPDPSTVAKYIDNDAKEAIDDAISRIGKLRAEWLDKLASSVLPPEIVKAANSKSGRQRMKAAKYVAANGYMLKEFPDHMEFWQKDQFLGGFKVEFKDGKITCLERKRNDRKPEDSENQAV